MSLNEGWVAAWGNAISIRVRRPENYGKNLTLRYPVTMLFDGSALRITLDNFCGTQLVRLHHAFAAKSGRGSDIIPESNQEITFGGSPRVTLPVGGSVQSDPIPLSFKRGERVSISLYFDDFTELRSAVNVTGPLSPGYFSVVADAFSAQLPRDLTNSTNWFYFLSGIEARTDENNRAIVCYGDSITAQAWPDFLMKRILSEGDGTVAVVRKAASGTRILRQYDNIVYDSYGLKGSTRFPHEVPVPGADTVIIQQGINDIIHPVGVDVNPFRPWSDLPTLEELIDALCDEMKLHHVDRLQKGLCTLTQGFVFNDLLTNYERVADHCSNIAVALIELESDSFDTHEYLSSVKELKSDAFARTYEDYGRVFKL